MNPPADQLTITFLGGLGEIGRNCAMLEIGDAALLIDCGLMFPNLDMPGVDFVLPDFSYILERKDNLLGCVVTHGHDDHVGGLPFLMTEVGFPLIGSQFTLELARHRLAEAKLDKDIQLVSVTDGQVLQLGPFTLEFIPVCHSVPHAFATCIGTPFGNVLHTGDWKIDLNPIDGRRTDLARMGAIAKGDGFRLLLSDSTNAEERGSSRSESDVREVLYSLFHEHEDRRIIATCFASHVHRVQQLADVAISFGRKVATLGLSMKRNVELARSLGILSIPESSLIDIEDAKGLPPDEVCIVTTGSQGEPMSALALMANEQSKWLKISDTDTIIMSSHPIPGNEMNVSRVLDGLMRLGAEVIHTGIADVHASGHAQQQEIKTLMSIVNSEYVVPVHGEYRHLRANARLALSMGVEAGKVIICEDGDQLVMTDSAITKSGSVPAPYVYVDGIIGDVGRRVLRDRITLSEEGVVFVAATIAVSSRRLLGGVDVQSRGWVHGPDAADLLASCAASAEHELINELSGTSGLSSERLNGIVRSAVSRVVQQSTRRKPTLIVSLNLVD